jgi:hypothetical protein
MDATTICNLALAKIGDLALVSLDDPTPEARFCRLFYLPTTQELFRVHDWNWATGYVQLSPITPEPGYDWSYAFGLPTDYSRMLTYNSFAPADPVTPYQIVGNQLYTDDSEAVISYIKSINDENLFDPLFVNALSTRLASKLARPLAGSMDLEKALLQQFEVSLAEARRIDAGEGIPRRRFQWVDSDLVQSRYNGIV